MDSIFEDDNTPLVSYTSSLLRQDSIDVACGIPGMKQYFIEIHGMSERKKKQDERRVIAFLSFLSKLMGMHGRIVVLKTSTKNLNWECSSQRERARDRLLKSHEPSMDQKA